MKIFKTLEIFKNSSNDCLEWWNKDGKVFSKKLPTKHTLCKKFSQHFLAFPENGSNFVTQKLAKNWKMPFSNVHNVRSFQTPTIFVLELKEASKSFSKKVPMIKFWLKQFFYVLPHFSRKWFQPRQLKIAKNWKFPFPNAQNIRFWSQGRFKTIF